MAKTVLTLMVETDLIQDAANDIEVIFRRLAKRHGAAFRELERRIEALSETDRWGEMATHQLLDGTVIFEPPSAFKEIIADARRLGVI